MRLEMAATVTPGRSAAKAQFFLASEKRSSGGGEGGGCKHKNRNKNSGHAELVGRSEV